MNKQELKDYLNELVETYNDQDFIENDPISIPHQYSQKQDIEIAGFFAASFAWGQRVTIINKSKLLMNLMDNSPHDFILNHTDSDLQAMENFVHRTFNATDLYYFIDRLQRYYTEFNSLEDAFSIHMKPNSKTIEPALIGFCESFFNVDYAPRRTQKHVASPAKKSTCKRLSMYLRWMVRNDKKGVDFGIWNTIKPSQLIIPFDVHVERMARDLKLLKRKQRDWQAVLELTTNLRKLDAEDPVKYDFALFGASVVNSNK